MWSPFSSLDFHLELGRQVAAELDRRGLSYALSDDAASVEVSGRTERLDLRSLAGGLAKRPVRDWAEDIGQQVDQVVSTAQESARFADQVRPLAEVADLLALRLVTGPEGHTRPIAEGLLAQLVYALPGAVTAVPDEHVRAWDVDPERLLDDAAARTRDLVRPLVAASHERQGNYDVLAHASPLTASTLLCVDEMIGPLAPYGVFVGVPSAHELVAYVITNASGASDAMAELPESLRARHARVPDPLSPSLYWWRAGEVLAVGSGEQPPEPLAEILRGLPTD